MKAIPLTQGKVALVDDGDFAWLNQWKWSASRTGKLRERWIAVRGVGTKPNTRTILMHRQVMEAQGSERVDHRDADGLNNQRGNLRKCTQAQNSLNNRGALRRRSAKFSKFKGVYWHAGAGKWMASFRRQYLGLFEDEVQAANAYDKAAIAFNPEFARPNFPTAGGEL